MHTYNRLRNGSEKPKLNTQLRGAEDEEFAEVARDFNCEDL
jgi:hypothetical protein